MTQDDDPDHDPLHGLPPELRALFEQLGGGDAAPDPDRLAAMVSGLGHHRPADGPVDWSLAEQVASQVAGEGDRPPSAAERDRAVEASSIAEHWLDTTGLPAPPDAGGLVVGSRTDWVRAALVSLRPLVEPVATASVDALVGLAGQQMGELGLVDQADELGLQLPDDVAEALSRLSGSDLGDLLRPAGAMLTGLQVGQVVGRLSQQLLGQYDLGVPTASTADAYHLAVNVDEAFSGYGLDDTEVAVVLAVTEGAHRRLYHAVGWLEGHLHTLVSEFAAGIEVDPDRLAELTDELMGGVDPEDPDALQSAMERAARFRLEPTDSQRRVLERIQGVVCLTGAWARHEAAEAVRGRLSSFGRIQEVLRRRRATRGDGEALLAGLLGLDLKPDDESVGDAFVAAVTDVRGDTGLHRALAHPENLPDTAELADPLRWLARTAGSGEVPDDLGALFAGLGDAPVEPSAAQRRSPSPADPLPDEPDDQPPSGTDGGSDGPDGGSDGTP